MIKFYLKHPGGPVDEIDPSMAPLAPSLKQQKAISIELSQHLPGNLTVSYHNEKWGVAWTHPDKTTTTGIARRFPDALIEAVHCANILVSDPMKSRR